METMMNRIYFIRQQKVMIDRDLAELYGVETRVLNQAVRRNIDRFPSDFIFQLSGAEFEDWISQLVISNSVKKGLRKRPLAFTEQGVAMLSSVLNSETAIQVNIQIIRIFTRMRAMIMSHKDILQQLEQMERKLAGHDEDMQLIFQYLKQLLIPAESPKRQRIGFRIKDEE
jgi:ORF6N domain-containing protein